MHTHKFLLAATAALCVTTILTSCSLLSNKEISVGTASPAEILEYYHCYQSGSGDLAFETKNFLNGNLLYNSFRENPQATLRKLNEYCQISSDPQYFIIAADMCRWLAMKAPQHEAVKLNLSALYYCQAATKAIGIHTTSDANTKQHDLVSYRVIPIYNEACAGLFSYLKQQTLLDHTSFTLLDAEDRRYAFVTPKKKLSVPPDMVADYSLCAEYTIQALMLTNRQSGLGVPLVARLSDRQCFTSLKTPPNMTLPVTLTVNLKQTGFDSFNVQITYQDTTLVESIEVDNGSVPKGQWPLALDFSTPLACFLSAQQDSNLISATLQPFKMEEESGLYMLDSYQPDKIPVIFVHGLLSSPNTWMQMINFLKNDTEIRTKYQFWFYRYSSGLPVVVSASGLRNALMTAYQEFADTPEKQKTFEKTVIVGHSMGGLLTRALLQKDPHYFIENMVGIKWPEIEDMLSNENSATIKEYITLTPIPYVHRAVFMAVPHRGAKMASWSLIQTLSSIIKMPKQLLDSVREGVAAYKRLTDKDSPFDQIKNECVTGLDNLRPNTRFVKVFSQSLMKDDLQIHSIIGNIYRENVPSGSDGIVPYSSSHLDGVASELIVKSGHSVHRTPAAMKELMRILVLNLKEKP